MRDLHPPDSIHMRVHVIEPFAKFATMRLVRRVRTWCGDYRYHASTAVRYGTCALVKLRHTRLAKLDNKQSMHSFRR